MAVFMSLGGNSAGDGFLVVPLGTTYEAEIALWTDAGTATVTLQASPNPANLVFSTAAPINISTVPTPVTVHSRKQSASRGDTTIQVLEGLAVVASFKVTSIKHPVVNFNGRFEARFGTDPYRPYINPIYMPPPAPDVVVPPSRTFGLEGEPDFVPGSTLIAPIVPTKLDMTGMGRVVRLNNPVAPRSHAAPVVSTVDSISGETTTGTETFLAGDPLIGQPVNFGPDTYLAANNDSTDTPGSPAPEEYWHAGDEPMALFEINIGSAFSPPAIYFKGASHVGPFTHKAKRLNETTRKRDSRPFAHGIVSLNNSADFAAAAKSAGALGLPFELQTFIDNRLNALLVDYAGLPPGPSLQRRNLVRRIGHLLGCLNTSYPLDPLLTTVAHQAVPPDVFTTRPGSSPADWQTMEQYKGKVDTALHAWPGGPPGGSSVVAYLTQFFSFDFEWDPFAFNTDENCGYHTGTLSGDLSMKGNHIGDPHTATVDGTHYDFQAVGEFTLLRNGDKMEIQVRQTPVPTANPVTDSYTGLTACVSINSAVAARVGAHRIAFQPGRDRQQLEFYVDGKPANLPNEGIDLGGSRVASFDANGETGLRIDCEDGTVLIATPTFWNNVWYIDVSVSHTSADEGVMGFVPKGSWLPRLRNGADVGPMPASLHDRYVTLYKTFADSWRVTDKTSLFVYAPGTSTKTFTDPDWPAEKPPCKLKPEFQIPGFQVPQGMPVARAEAICRIVADKDLYKNCVFDVATTGDEIFAQRYVFAEEVRLYGTSVKIVCHRAPSGRPYLPSDVTADVPAQPAVHSVVFTATVSPLTPGRPIPTGTVTFFIDSVPMNRPVQLDDRGLARVRVAGLKPGEHKIRATYSGGGKFDYHSSSSTNQVCTV
jgi:hypothetical protein